MRPIRAMARLSALGASRMSLLAWLGCDQRPTPRNGSVTAAEACGPEGWTAGAERLLPSRGAAELLPRRLPRCEPELDPAGCPEDGEAAQAATERDRDSGARHLPRWRCRLGVCSARRTRRLRQSGASGGAAMEIPAPDRTRRSSRVRADRQRLHAESEVPASDNARPPPGFPTAASPPC